MSFLSVEPQSRAVLESHSNSILSQFDTHLKIIQNRYLAFFEERQQIEVTYIDSLRKLHRNATTVDASFDARFEPTNIRSAWDRVRDNLENEASTHQTLVNTLDRDVIKPLKRLKETKDATRKRIRGDLKGSAETYADYAEKTISWLQQAFLKKYHPQEYDHSPEVSQRPQVVRNKSFGGKVSALFRGRREDSREPQLQGQLAKADMSLFEEVDDDDCRRAVAELNACRWDRIEDLGDGYNCLEDLVFTQTIKDVLVKYMDTMITTRVKYGDLEKRAATEVKTALAGTDASDLRASFRRALSFSVPPLTLYRIYRPGAYSELDSGLIFGVPLVDVATDKDNVPKVIRMCIEEVEKRGLDTKRIYPFHAPYSMSAAESELVRKFESEKSFSFNSVDNIRSVARLLMRYLSDIPEPLLVLSLKEYRNYMRYRGALLRHFSLVASHSDKNALTMKALTNRFTHNILRGNPDPPDGGDMKAQVMEDLIQNVHTLFDEHPSQSPPVPLPDVAETMSTYTYGSTTQHRPGLIHGMPTSTRSSFSSLPSEDAIGSCLTPSPTGLPSPQLGLPSSQTLMEGVDSTTTQAEVIPEVRGTKAAETLASDAPMGVVPAPPTSVVEWRLRQSRLFPQPAALTIPQSPSESVLSNISDFPLSSATSLQTGMGRFSP